jgi:hypothetical protein
MNEVLSRVRDVFVESPAERPSVWMAPVPDALDRVAVLGRPAAAAACASLLVLEAARATGAACALLASWGDTGMPRLRAPASRAAARTAGALRARALPATATGRLVRIELSGEPAVAAGELRRAIAAVRGPAAIALTRWRTDEVDAVLTEQDALVLVKAPGDDSALAEMTLDSLSQLGPPVTRRPPPPRVIGVLATAGVLAPGDRSGGLSELVG